MMAMEGSEDLIGPSDIAFELELTAAQLKVTHTALKSLRDDGGRAARAIAVCQIRATRKAPNRRLVSSPSRPLASDTRRIPP